MNFNSNSIRRRVAYPVQQCFRGAEPAVARGRALARKEPSCDASRKIDQVPDSPQQLLVARICGLMASQQWRPGHSPKWVQEETRCSDDDLARAIAQAILMAKQSLGAPGPKSLRAELGLFSRYIQAEARAAKPYVDLSDPPWVHPGKPRDECSEAVRVAYALLGGHPTGALQGDVVHIVTRAEQTLNRGIELAPDALRALWKVAMYGAAVEWEEYRENLETK